MSAVPEKVAKCRVCGSDVYEAGGDLRLPDGFSCDSCGAIVCNACCVAGDYDVWCSKACAVAASAKWVRQVTP